jgi:hypothetical protein
VIEKTVLCENEKEVDKKWRVRAGAGVWCLAVRRAAVRGRGSKKREKEKEIETGRERRRRRAKSKIRGRR